MHASADIRIRIQVWQILTPKIQNRYPVNNNPSGHSLDLMHLDSNHRLRYKGRASYLLLRLPTVPDNSDCISWLRIQYNTIQLSFDIALLTLKFRSALTRLGGANAVVLQSHCVRRTCSRSQHSNCLIWGSNPYSESYRLSALTNRPPCHTEVIREAFLFQWTSPLFIHASCELIKASD